MRPLVLVVHPVADLLLASSGYDQATRTVLLVVRKHALIYISVRENVSAVAMHLMVLDLTLVNDTVGDDVATDAVDLIVLNLATKIRVLGIISKFETVVDVWFFGVLHDVDQAKGADLMPLLPRLYACFVRLTFEEHDEVGVQLGLEPLVLDLVVVRRNLPEVQLSLKQLLVTCLRELGIHRAVRSQIVDNIFK